MNTVNILFTILVPSLHNILNQLRYYNWLHLATCFGRYPAIIRPTRNIVVKVHSTIFSTGIPLFTLKAFNVNNGIPLEKKLVECTLRALFLVGLMMAGYRPKHVAKCNQL